jgi:hypothetical protein
MVAPRKRRYLVRLRSLRATHGDARADEQAGVGEAGGNALDVLRPRALVGAEAHEEVGGEERAEEHDLRGEEEPDAELAVVESRVGPRGDCVGNIHEAGRN